MIVKRKMDGGIRQGLAWLHELWQHPGCSEFWMTAQTEEDYYHRVPIEIAPGIDSDELILYLGGLNLREISVLGDSAGLFYQPAKQLGIVSSEEADVFALADRLPAVDPLAKWPRKPLLLSLGSPQALSIDKVLAYLEQESLFAGAWVPARYHKEQIMRDYEGDPENVMTLIALHPSRRVMLGFDSALHYLVIWGPDNMVLPDIQEFMAP